MVCRSVIFLGVMPNFLCLQLTTCSRQIFAFSRDGALPFSRWVYDANRRTAAPVHAVWFAVFLSILLGSLVFAGPDATAAVFSLVVTGQYVAYSIPITARFLGKKELKRGPFTLGAFVSNFLGDNVYLFSTSALYRVLWSRRSP